MASLDRLADVVQQETMDLPALFAGISVTDYAAAQEWYDRLFGQPPSFHPNDVEAVWEVAPGRSVYVEDRPEHAGHALVTLFVDDLADRVAAITERGLEPHLDETYDNGVRKVTYRDPEGNEIGFGGETSSLVGPHTGSSARRSGSAASLRLRLSPSTSTTGTIRSSQPGRAQVRRPRSDIRAGPTSIRTRNASMSTPVASAKPIDFTTVSDENTKPAKTLAMMIAAATTTRELCRNPSTTASSGSAPCTWASRIRVTRKTS